MSDVITNFRISAIAVDTKGRVGHHESIIESRQIFHIEFYLPESFTIGDDLQIPVTVRNLGQEKLEYYLLAESSDDL